MKPLLIFRADGNASMGLGHIIRSLALADMLRENFNSHFLCRNPSDAIRQQILNICWRMTDIGHVPDEEEVPYLLQHFLTGREIVLLDGYRFDTDYQTQIKSKGNPLLCIDDIHPHPFVADAVINHAPGILPAAYSLARHTRLYLGLNYSLIRKPFLQAAQATRTIDKIENIFICFGGADPHNLSLKVLKGICGKVAGISSIHLVLGSAHRSEQIIQHFAHSCKENIQIHKNLSAVQMAQLMRKNDLAIVPASSILHEVTAVKMPVLSGYYVDNQEKVYQGFCQLNMIYGLGNLLEFDNYPAAISAIRKIPTATFIQQQQMHQNGQSAKRFTNILLDLHRKQQMPLGETSHCTTK